jgi:hypothetical protein
LSNIQEELTLAEWSTLDTSTTGTAGEIEEILSGSSWQEWLSIATKPVFAIENLRLEDSYRKVVERYVIY